MTFPPKHAMFSGELLDVGICAEDEDGDRFWCHFKSNSVEVMKRRYERYQEQKKKANETINGKEKTFRRARAD